MAAGFRSSFFFLNTLIILLILLFNGAKSVKLKRTKAGKTGKKQYDSAV